jgi:hypothetical protein
MHAMTDTKGPKWCPLNYIPSKLDHLKPAFPILGLLKSAASNAVLSGEAAVRGKRLNGNYFPSAGGVAFERLEKHLSWRADLDFGLSRIIIPSADPIYVPLRELHSSGGSFSGHFVEVEADLLAVEAWLLENAMPNWWQEAAADEGTPTRRGPPPKYDWAAIRDETFLLMNLNGDFSDDKPEWDRQARLEKKLQDFCSGKKRDDEPAPSTLREKLPGWLAEWRKQKAVGN